MAQKTKKQKTKKRKNKKKKDQKKQQKAKLYALINAILALIMLGIPAVIVYIVASPHTVLSYASTLVLYFVPIAITVQIASYFIRGKLFF